MSDDRIEVSRTIDAPAAEVFDVLGNPENHVDLDGSGFVLSVDQADRITAAGQVFTMNMAGDHMGGEYKTDNHVTGFDPNHLLAWKTAPAGTEPPGWQWTWTLEQSSPDRTEVTLAYDWSDVTDQKLLDKVGFPLVKKDQLESTLSKLAEAVAA